MPEATYKSILDNWINGNLSIAKEEFKRLNQIETIHFFNYLYEINFDNAIELINKLAK